jgi:hypothetical protein
MAGSYAVSARGRADFPWAQRQESAVVMARRNHISRTNRLKCNKARKKAKDQSPKKVVLRPDQLTIDPDAPLKNARDGGLSRWASLRRIFGLK